MHRKIGTSFLLVFLFCVPSMAHALRLSTIGFELNSTDFNVETSNNNASLASSPTHAGNFSMESVGNSFADQRFVILNSGTSTIFARVYIYVKTYPDATSTIFAVESTTQSSTVSDIAGIYMQPDGTLGLDYSDSGGTPAYSSRLVSTPLSQNTWHYIELESTSTAVNSQGMVGRLDGSQFGTFTSNLTAAANQANAVEWGQWLFLTTESCVICDATAGDIFYDDFAINDNTGSSQNTWPGAGNEILFVPNGAGDLNSWHRTNFNIGNANNYTIVYSVPPGQKNLLSTTTSSSDFYTVAASTTITSGSTINVVQLYDRFVRKAATPGAFKLQIEKASGGTRTTGIAITPAAATSSNTATAPFNPTLTLYNDPDGSPWTSSTIATMQIGATTTTAGSGGTYISGIWAYVDYVPATPAAVATYNPFLKIQGQLLKILGQLLKIKGGN